MIVVVYHGLSDLQGCLPDEVLEFLPATVRWDLPVFSALGFFSLGLRMLFYPLKEDDELVICGSSCSGTGFFAGWHCRVEG